MKKQLTALLVSLTFSALLSYFIVYGIDSDNYRVYRTVAATFYIGLLFYPFFYCYIVLGSEE